ncbi:MAG: Zn-ribbon domain-containing OB-fold protein [Candidatus Aminicenantia bacterium]
MSVPRYWREIPQRYRLEAGKCKKCGYIAFPLRQICPECKNTDFELVRLSDRGTILTYTIIRVAPKNFPFQSPYPVAIIGLDGGGRITAQITDANLEDIKIGARVRIVIRKIQEEGKDGIICYGYKAVIES